MTPENASLATVLITGAGGAAVPGLADGLRAQGFRVLTADMDPHAPGLYLSDGGYVIPAGVSPEFLPSLRAIVRRERVSVVIPLVDEELLPAFGLEADGVSVVLPRRQFVADCLDKLTLMERLAAAGIPHPATRRAEDGPAGLRFPLVLKPRTGRGSRGLFILHDQEALRAALASLPLGAAGQMLQECVEGPEFTVSVVAWRDGAVQAVVPKEIICKRGITRLAVTRRQGAVDKVCRAIQERLRADGPFNVQLRLDATGIPQIFEINPRFSTTVSLTVAAGVDEVGALVAQALGRPPACFDSWRTGLVLVRRTQDVFLDKERFTRLAPKSWEET